MAGLVDPGVHTTTEVLHKGAEEAAVHGPDGEVGIDGQESLRHGSSFELEEAGGSAVLLESAE
jgi:hypothetical protein